MLLLGSARAESWDVPVLPGCCGTALATGVFADIWVWGLVCCWFDVRNVGPLWLMRCNDCRSLCTQGGCLDDVNALNYVVNTVKQKLLMTTLAAGLVFSRLLPASLWFEMWCHFPKGSSESAPANLSK